MAQGRVRDGPEEVGTNAAQCQVDIAPERVVASASEIIAQQTQPERSLACSTDSASPNRPAGSTAEKLFYALTFRQQMRAAAAAIGGRPVEASLDGWLALARKRAECADLEPEERLKREALVKRIEGDCQKIEEAARDYALREFQSALLDGGAARHG